MALSRGNTTQEVIYGNVLSMHIRVIDILSNSGKEYYSLGIIILLRIYLVSSFQQLLWFHHPFRI